MKKENRRCDHCGKEEPEVELVKKSFRQNGEMIEKWFCKEDSCYGHYLMLLEI